MGRTAKHPLLRTGRALDGQEGVLAEEPFRRATGLHQRPDLESVQRRLQLFARERTQAVGERIAEIEAHAGPPLQCGSLPSNVGARGCTATRESVVRAQILVVRPA